MMDCGEEVEGSYNSFSPQAVCGLDVYHGNRKETRQCLLVKALPVRCLNVLGCPKTAEAT